jgi:hypothetical protein
MSDIVPKSSLTFHDSGDFVGAAFHGTSLASAEIITKSGEFQIPKRNDEEQRMGAGVYFWDSSQRAAERWAKKFYRTQSPTVIRAKVRLGRHLNLGISEHQEIFKDLAARMRRSTSDNLVYESQVYNLMVYKGWIETARRSHEWGNQEYLIGDIDRSWAKGFSDVMICVYRTALIEAPCVVCRTN